jgi:hypothetical protein
MSELQSFSDWYKALTERKDLVSKPDGRHGIAWNTIDNEGGITIEPKTHELINGVTKTIQLLRRIDSENKYIQLHGIWVGRNRHEACTVAAIAQETGNFKHDEKHWQIDNEAIIQGLGISTSIYAKLIEWNDEGSTYLDIANRLETQLRTGELLQ